MSFDADRYKNTTPYGSSDEAARIKADLMAQIEAGTLKVPVSGMFDPKWLHDNHIKPAMNKLRDAHRAEERRIEALFRSDMEEEYRLNELPRPAADRIHSIAWDRGHASGFHDVYHQYSDLVELARLAAGLPE